MICLVIVVPILLKHPTKDDRACDQKKIGTSFAVGERILVFSANGDFLSIGSVREFPQGTAIKSEIIM